jgi:membrane protease YdiL (CAAX protease family)
MFGISWAVGYDYSNMLNSLVEGQSLWLTFIFMVIIAPVGEELVFRKLLIDRTQKYGGFVSVLLSGLIFGLMHGNFYQFFYAFALGLLLGYVYYSTGKIHLTIAIHAVINFVGSVVAKTLTDAINSMNVDIESGVATEEEMINFLLNHGLTVAFMLAFIFFVLVAMACAVILPIVLRKRLALGKGEIEIPRGKTGRVVFLNVGIIVMIAVYIFEFVLNLIPA